MSWLYSIVFAGLLFSSNGVNTANTNINNAVQVPPAAAAAQDETEKFEQTYPLSANGRVSVSNVNGSIVVEAWDRNEVHLEATKIADSKEALADVEIRVDAKPDSISVEANYDTWKRNGDRNWKNNRKLEVQFRLQVPRTAVLNEIETVNGSVTLGNFVNTTKVSAVNGNVTATNLRGAANLSTVNGEVVADFDRLETGSRITLSTVNGRVDLVIPSDANATIKADSLNGNITNDFGLPVKKGQYVGRDLYGRVGTGEVSIKLDSVNGALAVRRKNDGKSPNPAVNLLQLKKAGDEDWDDDNDKERGAADKEKINREVARTVRQSQRATAEQIKEAQKAIVKVKPEIDKEAFKELSKIKIDADKLKAEIGDEIADQQAAFSVFRDANWPGPVIEKKRNSFPVKGTPKVTIQAKGCGVRVRGWDKPEVQYVVTEIARRRDREPVTVSESNKDSNITLNVTNPNDDSRPFGAFGDEERVRIDVFVPRKSNLKIVTDGEIRLDGVSGDIDLKGEDEAINVRDADGQLKLTAADGQVRVIGFKGDLNSQTADGDVFLEGDFQKLTAKAGDGTVFLTVSENTSASIVSNTDVEGEGVNVTKASDNLWRIGQGGTKYNFDFADGKLVVRCASLISSY